MMICNAVVEYEIDVIIISSPDRRWISTRVNQLKRIFRKISKNIKIIATDSRENQTNKYRWLPGGTVSILLGRTAGMLKTDSIQKDKKGS